MQLLDSRFDNLFDHLIPNSAPMTPEQIAAHQLAAKERARGVGRISGKFAGGHRVARIAKFHGEQQRKAKVTKSRRKMAKASQRKNRG